MPEGDTIFRAARQLRGVLVGRSVVRIGPGRAVASDRLVGSRVTSVDARGKHLLIHFDNALSLHSHLGMYGSWHVYRPGQVWRKPAERAAITLCTGEADVVCFYPKTLELLDEVQLRRHPHLLRLGPDLLAESIDESEILARFRAHNSTPLGEAVMNQTIACGVGNVYKSEILFVLGHNPFVFVESLGDEQMLQLIRKSRELLRRNLEGQKRRTRFGRDGARLWVYGRKGEACFRCGELIRLRRQGDLGRSTYWCPGCQPTSPP